MITARDIARSFGVSVLIGIVVAVGLGTLAVWVAAGQVLSAQQVRLDAQRSEVLRGRLLAEIALRQEALHGAGLAAMVTGDPELSPVQLAGAIARSQPLRNSQGVMLSLDLGDGRPAQSLSSARMNAAMKADLAEAISQAQADIDAPSSLVISSARAGGRLLMTTRAELPGGGAIVAAAAFPLTSLLPANAGTGVSLHPSSDSSAISGHEPLPGTGIALKIAPDTAAAVADRGLLTLIAGALLLPAIAIAFLAFLRNGRRLSAAVDLAKTRYQRLSRRQAQRGDRLALVSEHAKDSMALIDAEGVITWTNPAFQTLSGHDSGSLNGQDCRDILDRQELNESGMHRLDLALQSGLGTRLDMMNRASDGRTFWTEFDLIPIPHDASHGEGKPTFLTVERNITERKHTAERLRQAHDAIAYRAMHDSLTDLPNRQYLIDQLSQMLRDCHERGEEVAVLHVDIDRFKEVNDSYGHGAGDKVLQHVSRMMRRSLRHGDFIARVGGDEFVIVAPVDPKATEAERFGERILDAIASPLKIDDAECRVIANVGIAMSGDGPVTAGQLIMDTDIALYEAKKSGPGAVSVFRPAMGKAYSDRQQTLADLKIAVEERQFEPFYMPQIDLADGSLVGFELLARWYHPTRGLQAPAKFVDLAGEAGLIAQIDAMVLEKGLQGLKEMRAEGFDVPRLSINASSRTLCDENFVDWLQFLLDAQNLTPDDLAVEILEETMITDPTDIAARNVQHLNREGFEVELDDFGTGYAAMSNLAMLQLTAVKLDRSLIAPLPDGASESIVRAIISLGRELGLRVIAEGVESAEQTSILKRLRCDVIQGFGIGRPMSLSAAKAWCEETAEDRAPSLMLRQGAI
ncbi:MAG: EAL domain-containing protein [Pseudomonadota bacterium]